MESQDNVIAVGPVPTPESTQSDVIETLMKDDPGERISQVAGHAADGLRALKERIEALNGAINTVADQASSFQLTVEKELFELRSDLAGLDARVGALEAANNVLNEQLNQTLTLLRDFEIDKTVRQALEAQINALTLKTKAGFEHLGVNVDNLSGRNRRS